MFEGKLVSFLILFATVGVMTATLFWPELTEFALDEVYSIGPANTSRIEGLPMLDKDMRRVKLARFESVHNNIDRIQVADLQVVDHSESTATLSFRLTNQASENDFPSLRVTTLSQTGAKLRTLVFGSADYAHGSDFSSETVELHLETKPGDASFSVSAFYKD